MNEVEEQVVALPSADWSEIEYDLLALVADKIISLSPSDFIRLGAVCAPWQSFLIQNYEEIKLPNNLPLLLIPWPQDNQQKTTTESSNNNEEISEEFQGAGLNTNLNFEEKEIMAEDFDLTGQDYEEEEDDDDDEEEEEDDNDDEEDEQEEDEDVDADDAEEVSNGWVLHRYYDPKAIFEGQDSKRHKPTRAFYSLSQRKVYKDFHLAVPYFKNCLGSCKGWLVTVEEDENFTVQLFNPFRSVNNTIQLPPLTTLDLGDPDDCIQDSYDMIKVVLSASPSSISNPSDLVVMGLYGNHKPAFCRPGDTSWTCFRDKGFEFYDAIYYRDQFYAVQAGYQGQVLAFDVNPASHHPLQPRVTIIEEFPVVTVRRQIKKYLVESAGNLLQVHRYIGPYPDNDDSYYTQGFGVFKFDPLEPNNKWIEMKTLEGRILFLGGSGSLSLPAPNLPGWKPNCIYFTDDYFEYYVTGPSTGPHDMGVFNLENGSIEPHYLIPSKTILPAPLWIQPML